jgi:hypothetical protein
MRRDIKEVVFILPYLNANTTSSNRFYSFIKAFSKKSDIQVRVLEVIYPLTKSYFSGLDIHQNLFNYETEKINPLFNSLQRLGFYFNNLGKSWGWRICQLLHLIFYQRDIFYPGNIEFKKKSDVGVIIVSGGHYSFFISANQLAKETGYKLVLDYRDPWTYGYAPIDGLKFIHLLKKRICRNSEDILLNCADLITTVSKSLKDFFPKQFHFKIYITPNGSNYSIDEARSLNNKNDVFKIVYLGTIYNIQLKSELFFKAFSDFLRDKNHTKIQLIFLGANNSKLKSIIHKYKLQESSLTTQRLSREVVLDYLREASVFLHLKYGDKNQVITSKHADYLIFRKPILLPENDFGDLQDAITAYKSGFICSSYQEISDTLNMLWEKFKEGNNQELIDRINLQNITRDQIALNFANQVLSLLDEATPPSAQ